MNLKKHIPNLITLGNLFCGTVATIFAVEGDFVYAGLFVVLGILFDFFDGFAARLLHVSGELGKQLDSLADMVTSGVVPGIIVYKLLIANNSGLTDFNEQSYVPYLGLLLTLGACYRLAKFNIDTRQSDSFIGLPTPAMSLFIISLPLIQEYSTVAFAQELIASNYFLIAVTLILTYLMNAELPLFSLKFKDYSFKKNIIVYSFLFASLILIYTLHFLSIPFIIILYIIISLIKKIIVFNGSSQNSPE
ncbi:CDP-alcohol phosphatidyltransferase family protein [Polaribacter atrinae]|uniref:Phosphatidylserine synthase n=1 Tax=Polaribacter atrinae TaxID=1333662 RepID=A0A176TFD6_9FLAO|nr:CDP-alcohol phosphatidyltransferase family protein [Polaribacter atrinae]OAD46115.1 phosphatidylserine synthase [Polaribacter atrinae]